MIKKSQSAPCLAQIPEQIEDSANAIDRSANASGIESWQAADEFKMPYPQSVPQKTRMQLHHLENALSQDQANLAEQLQSVNQELIRRCDELSSQLMASNNETNSLQTTAVLGIQALRRQMQSLKQDTRFLKSECEMLTQKIRVVGEAKDMS